MKTIVLFLLLFIAKSSITQTVSFGWAKSIDRQGGFPIEGTYLIGVDALKNTYLAGTFFNTIDIDPGPGVFTVSASSYNTFLCKLDSLGNFIWGKQIGGNGSIVLKSLYVDLNGNIYTTGRFTGTIDFDPNASVFNLSPDLTCMPNPCGSVFISKLGSDGTLKWAKQIGGTSPEFVGNSITGDRFGNLFVTGYINGITDLDPGIGIDLQNEIARTTAFIVKLDSLGNYKYGKVFRTNDNAFGSYIRTDYDGNVYTAGQFAGKLDVDPGAGVFTLANPLSFFSAFICKLDSAGNFIWAKKDIGLGGFVVDAFQNFFVFTRTPGFLIKYDKNGDQLWTKFVGGFLLSYPNSSITLDASNNVYLTGMFRYTQDFDPSSNVFNLSTFNNDFQGDVFISRYDNNGNFVWAHSFGSFSEDFALSIALDTAGNIYSAGKYEQEVDFDPTVGIYKLKPIIGVGGIYIHKMNACKNRSYSFQTVNQCNSFTLNGVTYDKSGDYKQTIKNSNGCDSIISIQLNIGLKVSNFRIAACESYFWNGKIYNTSGIYKDTFLAKNGCDSIVTMDLTIKNKPTTTIVHTICEGESFLGYTKSGNYVDSFTSSNGCDSIRVLKLNVLTRSFRYDSVTICNGKSYLGYTSSGIYIDTFKSFNGCDSIIKLNLTVLPPLFIYIKKTICAGETYNGHSNPGVYLDTFHVFGGCDSIVNLDLSVLSKPLLSLPSDTAMCQNTSFYLEVGVYPSIKWQDSSSANKYLVTKPGVYLVRVSNQCGVVLSKSIVHDSLCSIIIPNVFSPNNDGNNDYWDIKGLESLKNVQLKVFDRYGQVVFESFGYKNKWNGNKNGVPLPVGSYYYNLIISDLNKQFAGSVTIIR